MNQRPDSDFSERRPDLGLTSEEAARRRLVHGPNALPAKAPMTFWWRLMRQFASPLILILVLAMVFDGVAWFLEGAQGLPLEALAIGFILSFNALLGVYQESKSASALARLQELSSPFTPVYRDGKLVRLPVQDLVPGDWVRIEAGNRIPADGELLQGTEILVDESVLTGESIPVEKDRPRAELWSGTQLVRGLALLEVTRTGPQSAMGRLADLIRAAPIESTPLEKRLDRFSRKLAWVVGLLVVIITISGVAHGGWQQLGTVFLFSVALAVAAIPEGMPAILTMTLALGVERMARRKAVVRRLSAVEALGSVTVIATDKTGTLTENRMSIKDLKTDHRQEALEALVLANDAEHEVAVGDPLELALIDYAATQGIDAKKLQTDRPRIESVPFDSNRKFMSVTVREDQNRVTYWKGAPEAIVDLLEQNTTQPNDWLRKAHELAAQGKRVLAIGQQVNLEPPRILGLVSLWDPPRPEVRDAIQQAQSAGIRVLMITGDHPATALAMAHEVGICSDTVVTGSELGQWDRSEWTAVSRRCNVFARVTPEHKLQLVEVLKADGHVVAMTGDGVNDAPALTRADVGVAMGLRGSDLAREVADLVLLDDNFSTIVAAIEEGRSIYENIQKFIRFLFSTNLAEMLIILGGAIGSASWGLFDVEGALLLPFTAVQLLWVNVITDGPAAVALGLDRNPGVMHLAPRHANSPLLDQRSLQFIAITAGIMALIAGSGLVVLPQFGFSTLEIRSAIFLFATVSQLAVAYVARKLSGMPHPNRWLHLGIGLGICLQFGAVASPWLRSLLGLEPMSISLWLVVGGMVGVSIGLVELTGKWLQLPGMRAESQPS